MIFGRKFRHDIQPLPGSAVITETSKFHITRGLTGSPVKTEVLSNKVWKNWNFSKVHRLTDASIAGIRNVGVLGFRDGTLLYCFEGGGWFVISERRRLPLTSDELSTHGYSQKEAIWVSKEELESHRIKVVV